MSKPFISTPGLQYFIVAGKYPYRTVWIVGFTEHGIPLVVDATTGGLIDFDLTVYGSDVRVSMQWGQIK